MLKIIVFLDFGNITFTKNTKNDNKFHTYYNYLLKLQPRTSL